MSPIEKHMLFIQSLVDAGIALYPCASLVPDAPCDPLALACAEAGARFDAAIDRLAEAELRAAESRALAAT